MKKIELTELEKKLISKEMEFFCYMWDAAGDGRDKEFSKIGWDIIPPIFVRVLESVNDVDIVNVDCFIEFLKGIDIDRLYDELVKKNDGEELDYELNLCYSLINVVVDFFEGKEIGDINVDNLDSSIPPNDNDPRSVVIEVFKFFITGNRNPHDLTIDEVEEYVISKIR